MSARLESLVMLEHLVPSPEARNIVSEATARRLNLVPLALQCLDTSVRLVVAGESETAVQQLARLERQLPGDVRAVLVEADGTQLESVLNKLYKPCISEIELLERCKTQQGVESLEREQVDYLVQLLEYIVRVAYRLKASDIHLTPDQSKLLVRFRIDGVLGCHAVLHVQVLTGLLVRIKILAALDIAESRHPQDGQFSQLIDAHQAHFRVSTFPTIHGENTVLRILDDNEQQACLKQLALPEALCASLSQQVQQPDGLLLVCGPTGSGKSTTLYALLGERDSDQLNIMTLEDPVERSVEGVCQSSIDPLRSLDFAHGVRALLRQDPDVLLIGEIRDPNSCAMVLRAAMTGHQVLSTLHAHSVFAALDRLRELGASNALLATNLMAVACQRLVRKCCSACSTGVESCRQCRGTGFQGRQVIMELLLITPMMADLMASGAKRVQLEAAAVEQGFMTLAQHADNLVAQNITSSDEVKRVLGDRLNNH